MQFYSCEIQTPVGLRSAFFAIPDGSPRPQEKICGVTVFRDEDTEESARAFLADTGFDKLVDRERIVVGFPNPVNGKWENGGGESLTDDEKFADAFISSGMGMFSKGWRPHNDVRQAVGSGTGATLLNVMCACRPSPALAASICTLGGEFPLSVRQRAVNSPVPAMLLDPDPEAMDYFIQANRAQHAAMGLYFCPFFPTQKVRVMQKTAFDQEAGRLMWDNFFRLTRRVNTSLLGDVDARVVPSQWNFDVHIGDTRLGDNGGMAHDWIEHCPASVAADPDKKVPLMLFSHGGGDILFNTADMAKFHEVGEREGFITVYPSSCNRGSWNLACDADKPSDVDYYLALIEYLKGKYPIDESRIYTSGFSNGAGFAMLFAMTHPELVAATCPVDSTFPYVSMGLFKPARMEPYLSVPGQERRSRPLFPAQDPEANYAPLMKALAKQREKAYRMPVMYFYGTRESEYPIRHGCNQELDYNFWKLFNGIPVAPTTDCLRPDAVGVAGETIRDFCPCPEHPDHRYTEHVFYTAEGHQDLYHFMLMHGKGHEVHPVERELGWAYVSRFRRLPDGSLEDSGK